MNDGGQGVVTRLVGPQDVVYKEYLKSAGTVNGQALAGLVEFGARLPHDDQKRLFFSCAWPTARIVEGNRAVGFLMPEVPDEFHDLIQGRPRLVELQFLLFPQKRAWQELRLPDLEGRIQLARRFAELVDFLHGHQYVIGDVSARNLLWSTHEPYKVHILDCDGFRRLGAESVLKQAHSPDWEDPLEPPTGPDLDTDRYKLALLIGRILARNAYVRPGGELPLLPGLPDDLVGRVRSTFARAAGPVGTRPSAREWARVIEGREWIAVSRPPVRPRPGPAISSPPRQRASQPTLPRITGRTPFPTSPPVAERKWIPVSPAGTTARLARPVPQAGITRPGNTVRAPEPVQTPVRGHGLGQKVVESAAYADQRVSILAKITDQQMVLLLDGLEQAAGALSVKQAARLISEPEDRTRLLIGEARKLLDVEGISVLVLKDGDKTLDLNIALLVEQFLEDEG
ncbi:hypothetical protein DP939_09555 [Spongiactinospora rosea]|uniref:Alkaline phosphatase-like protein PglZ C-terminal domain-containing protein n=1 Tax=Spongiactinospora rosea TaxID=2248750 RepID=A0A366M2N2_9ACTN|nr:hypothetical protein DP939_09555 [Spongiactinospora rosea]